MRFEIFWKDTGDGGVPRNKFCKIKHRVENSTSLGKQNDAFISLAILCGKIWGGIVFVLVTVHKTGVLGMKIRQRDVSTGAVKVGNYFRLLPQKMRKGVGKKKIRNAF